MSFRLLCLIILSLAGCHRDDGHTFQGYIEGENLYLASPYQGQLVEKFVSRGQRVKQGQLLFVLDPAPEQIIIAQNQAQVDQAVSLLLDLEKPKRAQEIEAISEQIAQADANLSLAELRVKRYEQLYQQNAVQLDRVDEAKALQRSDSALKAEYQANLALANLGARPDQVEAQKARAAELTAQLSFSQWQLKQKSIYAPADGVMFDTYYQPGEFVVATRPIASLLPDQQIRIEFFVPAHILPSLHLNQSIQFICDGCRQSTEAHIVYISPEAEYVPPLVYSRENENNLVFRIKASITQPTVFKPGQPVRVLIRPDHDR
jgi:HlyD family secretion protein